MAVLCCLNAKVPGGVWEQLPEMFVLYMLCLLCSSQNKKLQETSRSSLMERVFSRLCSHIMMYMIRLMHSSGFAVVVGGWVNKQYI